MGDRRGRGTAGTLAYTDFLLATAATGGVGLVCAALTPCLRLYAHLGAGLDPATAGDYAPWVRTYADPDFAGLARTLEDLLDAHAGNDPAVPRAYRRAMELEDFAVPREAIDGALAGS